MRNIKISDEHVTFPVEGDELQYVSIYSPAPHISGEFHYGVYLSKVYVPSDILDVIKPERDHIFAKSSTPPRVIAGAKNIDDIVRDLLRYDAMNVPRSVIFRGERLDLTVSIGTAELPGHRTPTRYFVALHSVRFATDNRFAGMGED